MECLAEILDVKYPQFNTVTSQHLLTDALYQMSRENVEYLIVLENDQFLGLLSEHDITQKLLFAGKPIAELTVGDLMNRQLPVADAADPLDYGMQLLDRYNTRYMAVYDGFVFKGVVSENDLLKTAIPNMEPVGMTADNVYSWSY